MIRRCVLRSLALAGASDRTNGRGRKAATVELIG
jgi:hypothetical protein